MLQNPGARYLRRVNPNDEQKIEDKDKEVPWTSITVQGWLAR
jgi:hypothetical protein